jgi:hypothetical protein
VTRSLPSWELGMIRKHPRVEFVEPARILCGDEIYFGRGRNLSLGGMLLEGLCTSCRARTCESASNCLTASRSIHMRESSTAARARALEWRSPDSTSTK